MSVTLWQQSAWNQILQKYDKERINKTSWIREDFDTEDIFRTTRSGSHDYLVINKSVPHWRLRWFKWAKQWLHAKDVCNFFDLCIVIRVIQMIDEIHLIIENYHESGEKIFSESFVGKLYSIELFLIILL